MPLRPYLNRKKKVIGYTKQVPHFRYVMLNQAGRLVPMDQPEAAKQLVDDFVSWSLTSQ
jgi:carboxypeptidase C (cathepsin A)